MARRSHGRGERQGQPEMDQVPPVRPRNPGERRNARRWRTGWRRRRRRYSAYPRGREGRLMQPQHLPLQSKVANHGRGAVAKILLGQDAAALPWCRKSVESNRSYPIAHFHYAAALALCGRTDEAEIEVKAGLALEPNFTIRHYREDTLSDNPVYLAQRRRILQGMRLAGVPDG